MEGEVFNTNLIRISKYLSRNVIVMKVGPRTWQWLNDQTMD